MIEGRDWRPGFGYNREGPACPRCGGRSIVLVDGPLCLDCDQYTPDSEGARRGYGAKSPIIPKTPETPIILIVGKKSFGKGTDYALGAAHRVNRVLPASFVFVGKNSEYITTTRPYIVNVPSVTQEELRDYYDDCLFLLHASLMDSLPRVILEATSFGRATVAAAGVGGVREMIDDGVTGFIVPPKDPAALATACLTLLRDPDRAIQMGGAAWKRRLPHGRSET